MSDVICGWDFGAFYYFSLFTFSGRFQWGYLSVSWCMLYTLLSAPQTLMAWMSCENRKIVVASVFTIIVTNLYAFEQPSLLLREVLTVKAFVIAGFFSCCVFFFLMEMNTDGMKMTDCSSSFAKKRYNASIILSVTSNLWIGPFICTTICSVVLHTLQVFNMVAECWVRNVYSSEKLTLLIGLLKNINKYWIPNVWK